MGRTPKPLRILVTTEEVYKSSQVQALVAKGHTVTFHPSEWDLILGVEAWQIDTALVKYVDLAVKAAWDRVYKKKGVTHDVSADQVGVAKGRAADVKQSDGRDSVAEGEVGDDGAAVDPAGGEG